ncbi:hypothetical protein CEXT_467931 [Caerostris extrusa]|uniref:Uncharacterized protein n=1 Tax=Caerostris extrusa TaxID=172846 RepID=A0AAV4V9X2_CAEEX|nr:hypothetical protein CEXT_467931 [Caerostris extrusa]
MWNIRKPTKITQLFNTNLNSSIRRSIAFVVYIIVLLNVPIQAEIEGGSGGGNKRQFCQLERCKTIKQSPSRECRLFGGVIRCTAQRYFARKTLSCISLSLPGRGCGEEEDGEEVIRIRRCNDEIMFTSRSQREQWVFVLMCRNDVEETMTLNGGIWRCFEVEQKGLLFLGSFGIK